jgi:imidazolonepropionase-like amidohydrolase
MKLQLPDILHQSLHSIRPGGKLEAINLVNKTGGVLEEAGVLFAFHSDDPIVDSRFLRRSAIMAVKEGMSREMALKALTINGAMMMDIDDRVGSLDPGKDADFVILSGDPFSVYTHVEQTWIEGEKVWDREDPEDRKYATGGYEIYRAAANHHVHMEGH